MVKKLKDLKPVEIMSALRVKKGIPFKTQEEELSNEEAEKLLTKKVTLGEVFDALDVLLVPYQQMNQKAFEEHEVLVRVVDQFLKDSGKTDKQVDAMYQDARKSFEKDQEKARKEQKEKAEKLRQEMIEESKKK